ncbi:MAG TPA: carboxypeptidase-like regulatory domain-containing protein, partial [Planctomycetota bacterium]|nr:carboxypeptidase-like regulatory domain-containing protein [Planctomycetota bacterium]
DLPAEGSKKHVDVGPLKLVPCSRLTFTVRAGGAPACSASIVVHCALPNLCGEDRRTRPQPSKRWSIALDRVSDDFDAQLHVSAATTTDAEGKAVLYLAPDRWCEVRIAFPGYATVRDQLCTSTEQPAHEEIDLEPDGRIGGRALAPDGKPLAGVPVEAYDGRPGDFHLAAVSTTDATGAFELADLASEQSYLLVVRGSDGLADLRASVAAPAVGVELVPERACSLDVRVTYPADRPAETLQLVLDRIDAPREGVAWATYHYAPNPVPVARFTGLLPGTYRVRCHSEFRFAPQVTEEIAVVASETRSVGLAVRQARTVKGNVKDEAGKPLRASYRVAVPGFFTTCGRSSSNGSFEIPGLPWFDVDVWISADGYEAKQVSLGSDLTSIPDVVLAKQQP